MRETIQKPIAIIGIGCRFPGAENPRAFWDLLREGRSGVREVPKDRWDIDLFFNPDAELPGKTSSRWGGFIDNVDQFDWRMFHMPPREAKYVDPQHRLLLEVAWEALEDAGLPQTQIRQSRTGVFMGISWNDYLRLQSQNWAKIDRYTAVGGPAAFAANRISYFFDFIGPSVSLDAGCTTSLASIYLACQSLWLEETTLALAGGVNLLLSPDAMIMTSKAGLLSPEGECRALDARANGMVRGEGAGIVVLKPLAQVQPSDRVYAIIRGATVTHNGHNEWIMGTSSSAQQAMLTDVYRKAAIDPAEVDYVELHGTGFLRGDAIEANALGAVLGVRDGRKHPCHIGSLKTNIGNLESAAGVASVIKVALSLYHREIPPTLNLQTINPAISLPTLGLTAQQAVGPWPDKVGAAIAGVNTLAFTGANGHIILEEASPHMHAHPSGVQDATEAFHLLTLSAQTQTALMALISTFKDFLFAQDAGDRLPWKDICYTASVRRNHHPSRLCLISNSPNNAATALEQYIQGDLVQGIYTSQGAQNTMGPSAPLAETVITQSELTLLFSQCQDMETTFAALEALASLYVAGYMVNWSALYANGHYQCVSLPTYPWQRERIWLDWLSHKTMSTDPELRYAQREALPVVGEGEPRTAFLRLLQEAPQEKQERMLLDHVTEQLVTALELDSAYVLHPKQKLFALGMDSLTAVALIRRLEASLERPLPATTIFNYPTVQSLTKYLAQDVLHLDGMSYHPEEERTESGGGGRVGRVESLTEDETNTLLMEKLAYLEKEL